MATTFKPATAKQIDFAITLFAKFYGKELGEVEFIRALGSNPSSSQVSKQIDLLKGLLATKSAQATHSVPVGIHTAGQVVYRVRENQAGTSRYAERLTTAHEREIDPTLGKWVYEGRKPLAQLSDTTLITLADAQTLGLGYGVCCMCGALLEDPFSVANGIGPVCAKKF